MHIVSVIPVQKGVPFDTLTYFSSDPLPAGYLVKITLQSRELFGFVVSSKPITDAKLDVKTSAFALKKIKQIIGPGSIDETFLQAGTLTARKSFVPIGALFGEIVPEEALEQRQYLARTIEHAAQSAIPSLIQEKDGARADEYKTIIRDTLGHGKSLLCIVPTIAKAEALFKTLSKGIERRSYLLHGEITKTEQKRTYRELFQETKGVLLVATPRFASIPWFIPHAMIIDSVSHVGYQTRSRFEIDYLEFFTTLSFLRGIHLYLGDRLLPFRHVWEDEKKIRALFPRRYAPEKMQSINISNRPFETLPKELGTLIRHVAATGKRLFLYTQRKGIAPYSVCRTCKSVLHCNNCRAALILSYATTTQGRERTFLCPDCGASEPATYSCQHCGSWDIEAKEIGTDAILDAIRALSVKVKLISIESERGSDENIRTELETQGPAIIVGTERAFSFLTEIDFSAVPHFDRLLGRTALDAGERTLRLLYMLDDITTDTVILLTKNPTQSLITAIEKKEVAQYVASEADVARALGYPPFGTILKITAWVPETEKGTAIKEIILSVKPLEAFHVSTKRIRPGTPSLILTFMVKAGKSFFEPGSSHYERFLEAIAQLPFRITIENNPKTLL